MPGHNVSATELAQVRVTWVARLHRRNGGVVERSNQITTSDAGERYRYGADTDQSEKLSLVHVSSRTTSPWGHTIGLELRLGL